VVTLYLRSIPVCVYSELRLLKWAQVDLNPCTRTVGNSKTEAGTGRLLPLNDRAVAFFGFWQAFSLCVNQIISFSLRNTGCTRMLEAGVPFSVVATIMGRSPSTTVRLPKRYGHIGPSAQRHAVSALKSAGVQEDGHKTDRNPTQARPLRQLAIH